MTDMWCYGMELFASTYYVACDVLSNIMTLDKWRGVVSSGA
jgi:hypothetical protein